ncbi:hypothetical protein, partial [Mesorhizobium sp. M7A.F.Ca.CA.004.05.2.1]|uniref:hypothetical protein n=1 Tax=Mesorhizobium sp. M7A.F.Ca.CA.004.05.2.1 TaxID=2496716 RepID=UPI0019D1B3E4
HQFHGEYPVKAGDDVLGHIHLVISSLAMRPPAGGGLFCQTSMTTARPTEDFIEYPTISID